MFTITTNAWPVIAGIEHIASDWITYADEALTQELDRVEDSEMWKDMYLSELTVPMGETYYVRNRKIFSDGSKSEWKTAEVTSPDDNSVVGLPITPEIETPFIKILDNSIINKEEVSVKIECSSFIGKGIGHGFTNWLLVDQHGKVVYQSLKDTDNLSAIEILKEDIADFDKITKLTVLVSYGSSLGVCSGFANYPVTISKTDITLVSNINNVLVGKDLKVEFNNPLNHKVKSITVKTVSGETLAIIIPDSNIITIPGAFITNDSNLELHFVVFIKEVPYSEVFILTSDNANQHNELNFSRRYTNKLSITDTKANYLPENIRAMELYNGDIYICKPNDSKIYIFNFDSVSGSLNEVGFLAGVNILAESKSGYSLFVTEDNKLIVDGYSNSKPTFFIFDLDITNRNATLLRTIVREDESDAIGFNGIVNTVSINEYLYIPVNSPEVKMVNIDTGVVTILTDSDISVEDKAKLIGSCIFNIGRHQYLQTGGENSLTRALDTDKNEWLDGPVTANNLTGDMKALPLMNGDVFVFTDVMDGKVSKDMVYEYKTQSFKAIDNELNIFVKPNSFIKLVNGNYLCISTDVNNSNLNYLYLLR